MLAQMWNSVNANAIPDHSVTKTIDYNQTRDEYKSKSAASFRILYCELAFNSRQQEERKW